MPNNETVRALRLRASNLRFDRGIVVVAACSERNAQVYEAYMLSEEMDGSNLARIAVDYLWQRANGEQDTEQAKRLIEGFEQWAIDSAEEEYAPTALFRPTLSAVSALIEALNYSLNATPNNISRCIEATYSCVFHYVDRIVQRRDGTRYDGNAVNQLPIVVEELEVQGRHLRLCESPVDFTPELLTALRADAHYEGRLSPFGRL